MGQSSAKAQHEKRLHRCFQSFQQLQHDIRYINLYCAQEFTLTLDQMHADFARLLDPHRSPSEHANSSAAYILQFRPFTKLTKKSALPWLWRVNNNVIIVVTLTPKHVVDALSSAAASPPSASLPAAASNPNVTVPLNTSHLSYSLTLREFYELFLYYLDNTKGVRTLQRSIWKVTKPDEYAEAVREAERKESEQKRNESQEEEKSSATNGKGGGGMNRPSSLPSLASSTAPLDCSICLSVPEEDCVGTELVVLPCLHAFCSDCLTQWKMQSSTCPLCRIELDADDDESSNSAEDDEWILTSPDLTQLRAQYTKLLAVPYEFLRTRGARFPPSDNKRGIKSAGDVFSLAIGEVLDVFQTTTTATPQQKQQQQASSPQQSLQSQQRRSSSSASASSSSAAIPIAQPIEGAPQPIAIPAHTSSSASTVSPYSRPHHDTASASSSPSDSNSSSVSLPSESKSGENSTTTTSAGSPMPIEGAVRTR